MKITVKKIVVATSLMLLSQTIYADGLTLKSNDLGSQLTSKQVFNGFGCKGDNISPQLSWSNIPKGTKSLAVSLYDPDAPTGSGWWHWVVFDIPANTKELSTGISTSKDFPKDAIQSRTDFGGYTFGGACPPEGHGYHTYTMTVYALDVDKLGLDKNASPALVGYMVNSHTIEKSSIISYYKR